MADLETIGAALQKRRLALHLTLIDLAAVTGYAPALLGAVERGKHKPTPDTVERIARGLMLSQDVLMNAFGYCLWWQMDEAVDHLLRIVGEHPPAQPD